MPMAIESLSQEGGRFTSKTSIPLRVVDIVHGIVLNYYCLDINIVHPGTGATMSALCLQVVVPL
jgi:hypothetical protein